VLGISHPPTKGKEINIIEEHKNISSEKKNFVSVLAWGEKREHSFSRCGGARTGTKEFGLSEDKENLGTEKSESYENESCQQHTVGNAKTRGKRHVVKKQFRRPVERIEIGRMSQKTRKRGAPTSR